MGIPKSVYDIALTYPQCLKFSSFFRYIFSPTFCYQLEYPSEAHFNPFGVIKYFIHCLVCVLMKVYLIF